MKRNYQSNRNKRVTATLSDRLISVAASLIFSLPTSMLLSLKISQNLLALELEFAIGGRGFILIVCLFSSIAFLFPKIFPCLLGGVWRLLVKT